MDCNHYRPARQPELYGSGGIHDSVSWAMLRSAFLKTGRMCVKYSHDNWYRKQGQANRILRGPVNIQSSYVFILSFIFRAVNSRVRSHSSHWILVTSVKRNTYERVQATRRGGSYRDLCDEASGKTTKSDRALALGVSPGTISRELTRNTGLRG